MSETTPILLGLVVLCALGIRRSWLSWREWSRARAQQRARQYAIEPWDRDDRFLGRLWGTLQVLTALLLAWGAYADPGVRRYVLGMVVFGAILMVWLLAARWWPRRS